MAVQRIEFGLRDAASAGGCGCGGGACMCGGHGDAHRGGAARGHAADADVSAPAGEVRTELLVDGMTCEHCVRSVTEELSEVPGVTGVAVDLVAGGTSRVLVGSRGPVDPAAVADAVAEAGYTLRTA